MNVAQLAMRLRDQMDEFLGNLRGVPKTARRFCLEALYGVTTGKSLRLSEIARSLNEDIALIKTENRLSRQAGRKGLWRKLGDFVVRRGAHKVAKDTLLVIDPSDIAKKYGREMEYIATVRDGSDGGYANGYWLCQVVAVECGGQEITPLVNHLWSQRDPEFKSENNEVLSCVETVCRHTGSNGIWVMDRGGDRMSIYEPLLQMKQRFLIRLVGNRHLVFKGRHVLAEDLAAQCPIKHVEHVTKQRADGSEQCIELKYGMRPVSLPGFEHTPLRLVVLHGLGEKPMMILTTEPLTDSYKSLSWAIQAYLTRWRIEDTLRFAKQTYAIEDVRVLGYESLRNMMGIALLAMSFNMLWLGQRERLAVLVRHAIKAAKLLFGVANFRYYAIADGLAEILGKRIAQVFQHPTELTEDAQLDMLRFFDG